jgi:hypothetical protein
VGREPAASPPVIYTQHHDEADPDFGSCRDKEMLDHLDNELDNEPVVVKRGQHIVEVNPQGISKGMVDSLLSSRVRTGTDRVDGMEDAAKVFDEMLTKGEEAPSAVMYNALINSYCTGANMEGLCADKTQQLVDITDWIVDTEITLLRDNNRPKPGGNVTFGELLTSSVLTAGVWVLMLVWNARTSVGLFKKDGLLAAHDEEPANYFQGHGCVVDFELKLEECQLKQYQWEQEQMASMKEYIARFGPGSAKLVRGIKQPWPPPRAVPPRLDYSDDEASVGSAGTRLYPLTKKRAKPAVPLGANYRLIDIPVSSCLNSNIIGLLCSTFAQMEFYYLDFSLLISAYSVLEYCFVIIYVTIA